MWLLVLIWAVPSLSRDTFWHIFIEGNRNDCQIKHDDTWIYIQGGNVNKCMISNTVNMYICPSAWYPIPSTCTYVTKLGYQTLSQPKSVGTLEVNTITFGASIHCHEGAVLPLAHCRHTFWSQSNVQQSDQSWSNTHHDWSDIVVTRCILEYYKQCAFNNQISLGRTLIMTEVTSW